MRLASLLLLTATIANAQAPAEGTPYALLHRTLATADAAKSFDRLVAIQRVESKLDGVTPGRIKITIRSRRGDLAVPVKGDGEIAFPVTPELENENPLVVTNQPRGSLTLTVTLALRLPEGSRVPVGEIEAALAQVDLLLARQAGSGRAPRVRGVEFQFPTGAAGGVTLRGRSERWLMADASGRVRLMRAGDLDAAVTELEFAARPLLALPYLEN